MTMRRVAITGMGIICANGKDLNTTWNNILKGQGGISSIENSDTERMGVKFAGEVKNFQLDAGLLTAKDAPRYDRFIHFALHTASEAMKDAKLGDNLGGHNPSRVGSILGVGMAGFHTIEENYHTFLEKGSRRISPFFIPGVIPNMSTGLISIQKGLKGVNYTVSSACASASHAFSAACFEILSGRHDMMITGGAESVITNLVVNGFNNMKALSKWNDRPEEACRPFDRDRNGFVIGEGAGILVVENLEMARKRGAKIYAEVVGHGTSSDAHHITAPHPEGDGASQCMKNALLSANIDPEQVGHINAHGTSTPLGDKAEVNAIKKTFGDHSKNLIISSTKSMIGHLLGAAGGVETIFCAMALHHGKIPPTINLDNPDLELDLNFNPKVSTDADIKYALNNSFGFGGTNSSTILKKYEE